MGTGDYRGITVTGVTGTGTGSVSHGCDKPQGDTGRGMEGWGQGMKKSTRDKPQPLWRVHG